MVIRFLSGSSLPLVLAEMRGLRIGLLPIIHLESVLSKSGEILSVSFLLIQVLSEALLARLSAHG